MYPDKDLIWNTVYATTFALIRCQQTDMFGKPSLDETAQTAAFLACEAVNRIPKIHVAGKPADAHAPGDAAAPC